jgi:hypothetical protein
MVDQPDKGQETNNAPIIGLHPARNAQHDQSDEHKPSNRQVSYFRQALSFERAVHTNYEESSGAPYRYYIGVKPSYLQGPPTQGERPSNLSRQLDLREN